LGQVSADISSEGLLDAVRKTIVLHRHPKSGAACSRPACVPTSPGTVRPQSTLRSTPFDAGQGHHMNIERISTSPIAGMKPGTSGLRKKVTEFAHGLYPGELRAVGL